jgi:hypothetical protein
MSLFYLRDGLLLLLLRGRKIAFSGQQSAFSKNNDKRQENSLAAAAEKILPPILPSLSAAVANVPLVCRGGGSAAADVSLMICRDEWVRNEVSVCRKTNPTRLKALRELEYSCSTYVLICQEEVCLVGED